VQKIEPYKIKVRNPIVSRCGLKEPIPNSASYYRSLRGYLVFMWAHDKLCLCRSVELVHVWWRVLVLQFCCSV